MGEWLIRDWYVGWQRGGKHAECRKGIREVTTGPEQKSSPDMTASNGGKAQRLLERMNQGSPTSIWPVLVFALIVLGAGLGATAALATGVTTGAITALVTAVLGVVGTHIGHMAGHELATKQAATHPLAASLAQLGQLHAAGKVSDEEFMAAKSILLGRIPDVGVQAPEGLAS